MSKPKLNLSGEESSIYAVLGRASRLLHQNGLVTEADEMYFRVNSANGFEEAMQVINDYVETEIAPEKAGQSLAQEERLHSRLLDLAKHHIFPVQLRGNLDYKGDECADYLIVSVGSIDGALRAAYDLGRGERQRERDSTRKQKKRGQTHER